MKSIIRKFLSLSLAVVLAAAPLNAFASDALGDDLASSSVEVNERTELNAGTFWSNTYSDLRQENYVVYSPNARVKPIVSGGDYTTQLTTVSTAAKKLEARGYRVVAGINGDYYDTATGIPLGSMMTEGVLRNASSEYYAIGFRDDGSTVMGKPSLRITAQSDYGRSLTVTAFNYVRQSSFGIYLYDSTFNARATTGTSEEGVDVVCSAVGGSLGLNGSLTLVVEQVIEGGKDTPVGAGQYVLSSNLKAAGYVEQLRALQSGERLTLSVSANGSEWNGVTNMIGALYQLVDNGQVCSGLVNGAAPRTAVGLKRDGSLVLYTIDGRQSGYSIGATLTQVAERMVELGCVTALSLDGSGSSPDSTVSTLVDKPSGGSERAVTNHIFLVADSRPTNSVGHVYLESESTRVLPNAQVKLTATALDTNYIPMANSNVSLRADKGTIDGDVLAGRDAARRQGHDRRQCPDRARLRHRDGDGERGRRERADEDRCHHAARQHQRQAERQGRERYHAQRGRDGDADRLGDVPPFAGARRQQGLYLDRAGQCRHDRKRRVYGVRQHRQRQRDGEPRPHFRDGPCDGDGARPAHARRL